VSLLKGVVALVVCGWIAAPLTAQDDDTGGKVEALSKRVKDAAEAAQRANAEEQRTRTAVAKRLESLSKAAIPALLKVIRAEDGIYDPRFAADCRTALERLGWVSPETKKQMEVLVGAIKTDKFQGDDILSVVEIGGYAVKELVTLLDSNDLRSKTDARVLVLQLLGELGAAARLEVVPLLLNRLGSRTVEERVAVCVALATAAVVPVDELDGTPDARRVAARDKTLAGGGGVGRLLRTLRHDVDTEVRAAAAAAVGAFARKDAVEALMAALGDSGSDVRGAAADALAEITDESADGAAAWTAWWTGAKAGYPAQVAVPAKNG
jgi:hypothetical protein